MRTVRDPRDHPLDRTLRASRFLYDGFRTVRAERQERVRLVNALLAPVRIRVSDWAASSYLVTSATGRSEIVDDIQAVWTAVERLRGAPLDPLDENYLRALGAEGRVS